MSTLGGLGKGESVGTTRSLLLPAPTPGRSFGINVSRTEVRPQQKAVAGMPTAGSIAGRRRVTRDPSIPFASISSQHRSDDSKTPSRHQGGSTTAGAAVTSARSVSIASASDSVASSHSSPPVEEGALYDVALARARSVVSSDSSGSSSSNYEQVAAGYLTTRERAALSGVNEIVNGGDGRIQTSVTSASHRHPTRRYLDPTLTHLPLHLDTQGETVASATNTEDVFRGATEVETNLESAHTPVYLAPTQSTSGTQTPASKPTQMESQPAPPMQDAPHKRGASSREAMKNGNPKGQASRKSSSMPEDPLKVDSLVGRRNEGKDDLLVVIDLSHRPSLIDDVPPANQGPNFKTQHQGCFPADSKRLVLNDEIESKKNISISAPNHDIRGPSRTVNSPSVEDHSLVKPTEATETFPGHRQGHRGSAPRHYHQQHGLNPYAGLIRELLERKTTDPTGSGVLLTSNQHATSELNNGAGAAPIGSTPKHGSVEHGINTSFSGSVQGAGGSITSAAGESTAVAPLVKREHSSIYATSQSTSHKKAPSPSPRPRATAPPAPTRNIGEAMQETDSTASLNRKRECRPLLSSTKIWDRLYCEGVINAARTELLHDQAQRLVQADSEQRELDECTFHPHTGHNRKGSVSADGAEGFFERLTADAERKRRAREEAARKKQAAEDKRLADEIIALKKRPGIRGATPTLVRDGSDKLHQRLYSQAQQKTAAAERKREEAVRSNKDLTFRPDIVGQGRVASGEDLSAHERSRIEVKRGAMIKRAEARQKERLEAMKNANTDLETTKKKIQISLAERAAARDRLAAVKAEVERQHRLQAVLHAGCKQPTADNSTPNAQRCLRGNNAYHRSLDEIVSYGF